MGQQIYSMLLSLVVSSLSARYLGPSNYGLLNYGSTLISFFTIVSALGYTNVIINEMVKSPKKTGSYLGSALVSRLVASVLSVAAVCLVIYILEPDNQLLQFITFLQAISIIFQSYEVFTYYFQMKLQMKVVSIATMIALTATAIWRIGLLANGASVQYFALTNSIRYLVAGAVVIAIFFKASNVKLSFSMTDTKFLLGKSYHLIISGIASTVCVQIDKIMVGKMLGETKLGYYAAAVTIAELWEFVPNALVNSARPLILAKREDNYQEYEKRFQLLSLGITILGLTVAILFMFLGGLAIRILYGTAYMEAKAPLYILVWGIMVSSIGYARNVWLVAEDCQSYVKYFTIAGAVFDILANLWFIPTFGIAGAAMTSCASYVIVGFIGPLFVKKTRRFIKLYFESFKYLPELVQLVKGTISSKLFHK